MYTEPPIHLDFQVLLTGKTPKGFLTNLYDEMRIQMVRDRKPAAEINIISQQYLKELAIESG